MFDKEKWNNINLTQYIEKKLLEKKSDYSIIDIFKKSDYDSIKIKKDLLKGIPFALKDNFSVKGSHTTAGSKIIREFLPLYNSTVFIKLVENGAIPAFKSNLDELAMGGTGLTSSYGLVKNPFDKNFLIGGSSSGSNYLVADKTVPFSIGSDTGDSIRKPASYTGIVGFKPTWGLVSRFGLYDFAPTFDTVGWFTNDIKESAILLDILQGYDGKDGSSLHPKEKNFLKEIDLKNEKFKIVLIKELEEQIVNEKVFEDYKKSIDILKKDGHEIIYADKVNIKLLSTILTVYRVISSMEAFSCNSNLTGFHFGTYFNEGKNYEEKMINARTIGFDYEVKKRFLWAQEAKYSDKNNYIRANKLRTLINNEINRILSLGDILLTPSSPNTAPSIENLSNSSSFNLLNNILTLFNFNGSPSLTMPITKNKHLSTSVSISALPFNDKKVFKISNRLMELI